MKGKFIKQINNLKIYYTEIYQYAAWSPDGCCLEDRMTLEQAEEWCENTRDFVIQRRRAYQEAGFRDSHEGTNFKRMFKRFYDGAPKHLSYSTGDWRISVGGYDKWWELYLKYTPVMDCTAGTISCGNPEFLKENKYNPDILVQMVSDFLEELGVELKN